MPANEDSRLTVLAIRTYNPPTFRWVKSLLVRVFVSSDRTDLLLIAFIGAH